MKKVFLGLLAASVLTAGLFTVDAPATAADLKLTRSPREVVRHVTVLPRCPGSVAEFAESPWTDRCFWWAYHWQNDRHYRARTTTTWYPGTVSYRN